MPVASGVQPTKIFAVTSSMGLKIAANENVLSAKKKLAELKVIVLHEI